MKLKNILIVVKDILKLFMLQLAELLRIPGDGLCVGVAVEEVSHKL